MGAAGADNKFVRVHRGCDLMRRKRLRAYLGAVLRAAEESSHSWKALLPSVLPAPLEFVACSSLDLFADPCAICLEAMTGDGNAATDDMTRGTLGIAGITKVASLPCGHCFPAGCIWVWLRVSSTCPLCKCSLADCCDTSPLFDDRG